MTAATLSPEAQQVFDKLERATIDGNWYENYLAMLKRLASRELRDIADVEVKGQGLAALEASHEEHRIATELKAYAAALLPADISAAVAKLPAQVSLEAFLERLMPNTGREVRRERFNLFLTHEAEMEVDEQLKLFPKGLTREESIARMVRARLANLMHADIPALSQYDIQQSFSSWSKSQDGGNLAGAIVTTKRSKAENMDKMLELLPCSNRPNEGLTKREWKDKAKLQLNISERTFDRYFDDLGDRFEGREAGRFRRKGKVPEKR